MFDKGRPATPASVTVIPRITSAWPTCNDPDLITESVPEVESIEKTLFEFPDVIANESLSPVAATSRSESAA